MAIKKHTDGSGRIRWRVYVYDASRRRQFYVATLDRMKDAQEAEYEAKRRLRLGEPLKPKPPREEVTFDVLGERWLASRANIRRNTRVDYRQSLRRLHPFVGGLLVTDITRKEVDQAITGLSARYSPSTVRKAMIIFSMVMKTGLSWGHLDRLPTSGQKLALPKIRHRPFEPLTPEQVSHFIDCAPEYWRPAMLLLFTAGTRRSELLGARVVDLDLEAGTIFIRYQLQKGGLVEPKSDAAVRRIKLPTRTIEALRIHLDHVPENELGLLFPNPSGRTPHPDSWFHRVWVPTRDKAGLPHLRVHDARAHVASVLLSQGRSVKLVQRMLGHSTAAVLLEWYAFVTTQEEDVAATDLDRWMGEEERAAYLTNGVSEDAGGALARRCRLRAA